MSSSTKGHVWFITGTSRGIGLELTRQLLQSPTNTVVAACRTPPKAPALNALEADGKGKLYVVTIDVDDEHSIRACADEVTRLLGGDGVDYLINNAAANPTQTDLASTVTSQDMQQVFLTNVIGPAQVTQAFLPLLRRSEKKTVVNISSFGGSIGIDRGPMNASYSISKTALNMLSYKQAKELTDLMVISMCPGWLQTDMGGPNWEYPVSVGVEGVLKVIATLIPEMSGTFVNFEGKQLPW